MTRKRLMALGLTICMLVGAVLTGCGGNQDQGGSSAQQGSAAQPSQSQAAQESSKAESEAPAEEELEAKTIQLWLMGPGKQKDADMVWEAFNEKLKEYVPNTTVELTIIPGSEYNDKFQQMLSAGEKVDLAWVGYLVGSVYDQAADGNLLPLNDLLEQYGQGIIESLGQELFDRCVFSDGLNYAVPAWSGNIDAKYGYRLPTELVELAGDTWLEDTTAAIDKWMNTPKSLDNFQAVIDQFEIYLKAAKDAGKFGSGVDVRYAWAWNYNTFLCKATDFSRVGVEWLNEDFQVIDAVDTEYFRLWAKTMADWYNKGYVRSDIASYDAAQFNVPQNGEYADNTVILYNHMAWIPGEVDRVSKMSGTDMTIIPVERRAYLMKPDNAATGIPYCADEPERAMMVLNAIFSHPDLYNLLIYGIEGVHYTLNDDGTITTPYGAQAEADADYGLYRFSIGNCRDAYLTQVDPPHYYEQLAEAEKEAYDCPFQGVVWNTDEWADIQTAIRAVDGQYAWMIQTGYSGDDWEENLNKWIAERKAAGVDEMVAIVQKQVDAVLAEKNITDWNY